MRRLASMRCLAVACRRMRARWEGLLSSPWCRGGQRGGGSPPKVSEGIAEVFEDSFDECRCCQFERE